MADNRRKLALVGLVLLIGLAGWAGCASFQRTLGDDEERPPIVIFAASLHFGNGYGWVDVEGGKKWRPNHPKGKPVKRYEVLVTARNNADVCGVKSAKTIVIDYEGRIFTLNLKRHSGGQKDEPELESPDVLTIDKSGMILGLALAGNMKTITIDNTPCPVDTLEDVKITAKPEEEDE